MIAATTPRIFEGARTLLFNCDSWYTVSGVDESHQIKIIILSIDLIFVHHRDMSDCIKYGYNPYKKELAKMGEN